MTKVQFQKVNHLINQKNLSEAESLCLELSKKHGRDKELLLLFLRIYLQKNEIQLAIGILKELVIEQPDSHEFCSILANLYGKLGDFRSASVSYQNYLVHCFEDTEARYNYAYHLRHAGEFEKSLTNYRVALDQGIEKPEEVLVNMAVIYNDHLHNSEKARKLLGVALQKNSRYTPALFNLANLLEQSGDRKQSQKLFESIIQIDPYNFDALARLADIIKFNHVDDKLIISLRNALKFRGLDTHSRINILFALGKAYDDCKEYNLAFEYYEKANFFDKQSLEPYVKSDIEKKINDIECLFDREWFDKNGSTSDYEPVIICGMFRSGSTLIEQILGTHSSITAGGELEFFIRKIEAEMSPFPSGVSKLSEVDFIRIANEYRQYIERSFPSSTLVTDKRPDNFLYVGLIKTLFPKAKIVFTERNSLDNCLSIFFQRLGNNMNYSTDLENSAHYYLQQKKLQTYWQRIFKDTSIVVNYDELIDEPEATTKRVFEFLGLEWSARCLDFYRSDDVVKTASVWQIRQPLYSSSSGRWKNYQAKLPKLMNYFGVDVTK